MIWAAVAVAFVAGLWCGSSLERRAMRRRAERVMAMFGARDRDAMRDMVRRFNHLRVVRGDDSGDDSGDAA